MPLISLSFLDVYAAGFVLFIYVMSVDLDYHGFSSCSGSASDISPLLGLSC
jgi:hypothetical protein